MASIDDKRNADCRWSEEIIDNRSKKNNTGKHKFNGYLMKLKNDNFVKTVELGMIH